MKTNKIILLVALLMTTAIATAQTKKWNTDFALGVTDNSGNIDKFELKNSAKLLYYDTTMQFNVNYKLNYELNNGHEKKKEIEGSIKYDFYDFGRWTTFVAYEIMSNHYKGYDCKMSILTGAKYRFAYKRDTCEYALSAAIVYEQMDYTDEDTYLKEQMWRISLRQKSMQRFGNNLMLTLLTFYKPAIKDFSDYIIDVSFHLENKLSKHFYLDLSYNYEYRSKIPSYKYRRFDSTTELTLKLKF